MLETILHDLMEESQNPTVAPYAKTGEVQLRVTARVKDGEDPQALLLPVMQTIREKVGEFLYGIDVGNLQQQYKNSKKNIFGWLWQKVAPEDMWQNGLPMSAGLPRYLSAESVPTPTA